jgi:hypothetical protein
MSTSLPSPPEKGKEPMIADDQLNETLFFPQGRSSASPSRHKGPRRRWECRSRFGSRERCRQRTDVPEYSGRSPPLQRRLKAPEQARRPRPTRFGQEGFGYSGHQDPPPARVTVSHARRDTPTSRIRSAQSRPNPGCFRLRKSTGDLSWDRNRLDIGPARSSCRTVRIGGRLGKLRQAPPPTSRAGPAFRQEGEGLSARKNGIPPRGASGGPLAAGQKPLTPFRRSPASGMPKLPSASRSRSAPWPASQRPEQPQGPCRKQDGDPP